MGSHPSVVLKGMTWDHKRGLAPVLATSAEYSRNHPGVEISWDCRSLQDFESKPLQEMAETCDLMIIDHPHVGEAVNRGLLVDFAGLGRDQELSSIAGQSAGMSHASYSISGGQWALAVDAATPVASYRQGGLGHVPRNWEELVSVARTGAAIIPLRPPHALMAFFWLAGNRGFRIAGDPEKLLPEAAMLEVLEQFAELAGLVASDCLGMDPIDVYETMSGGRAAPSYCPHAYGFINYAVKGFRSHSLIFTDVPDIAGGGVSGTVLGGTGLAVSAFSANRDIAADYAMWVAGAECQSSLWVNSGGQPGNRKAWSSNECNGACGGFMSGTLATLEAAWVRPRYAGYLAFQSQASAAIADFLEGRMSGKGSVAEIQRLYKNSLEFAL